MTNSNSDYMRRWHKMLDAIMHVGGKRPVEDTVILLETIQTVFGREVYLFVREALLE